MAFVYKIKTFLHLPRILIQVLVVRFQLRFSSYFSIYGNLKNTNSVKKFLLHMLHQLNVDVTKFLHNF